MFLNAVILILQEILEAALLVSVMLVLTRVTRDQWQAANRQRSRWVWVAIASGIAGAWAYAELMPVIAQWFDYVGQEVTNAGFQLVTIGLLLLFCYSLPSAGDEAGIWHQRMASFCLIGIISLAIIREGSEIILYLGGIISQPELVTPVLLGSLVAAGIGVSSGVILYFGMRALKAITAFRIAVILLGLFAGNMAAQSVLLLTQADWLPYSVELWDSSAFIAEYTVSGQLLYALVGYEATPSLLQFISYVGVFALLALSPFFRHAWRGSGEAHHEIA